MPITVCDAVKGTLSGLCGIAPITDEETESQKELRVIPKVTHLAELGFEHKALKNLSAFNRARQALSCWGPK